MVGETPPALSLRPAQILHEPPWDRIRYSAEEAAHQPPDIRRGLKFMHKCALPHDDELGGGNRTDPFSSKIRRQQLLHQAALSEGTPRILGHSNYQDILDVSVSVFRTHLKRQDMRNRYTGRLPVGKRVTG
jgi:hypothetical protein